MDPFRNVRTILENKRTIIIILINIGVDNFFAYRQSRVSISNTLHKYAISKTFLRKIKDSFILRTLGLQLTSLEL